MTTSPRETAKISTRDVLRYQGRVLVQTFVDFKWYWDLLVATGVAAATVFLQVVFGLIAVADWQSHKGAWIASVTIPYAVVLLGHIGVRYLKAAALIDQERMAELETKRNEELEAQKRLDEIQKRLRETPRIKEVRDSYKCDMRNWKEQRVTPHVTQICSLVVSFTNEPEFHCESAIAKGVIAKMEFFNIDLAESPIRLFDVPGRWATNVQPQSLGQQQTNKDILATDIRIGETVELDIAFRFVDENELFAISNDSRPQVSRNPKLALTGRRFLVNVRLLAVGVNESFQFKFENLGKWDTLKILN